MTSQTALLLTICAFLVAGLLAMMTGWQQARSFLATHTSIASQCELDEFKRVVKVNMYLALAMMAIFGIVLILAGVGIYLGTFSLPQLLLSLMVFGPLCAVAGMMMTRCENKMKTTLTIDPSMRQQFDYVVQRWTSNALPDW